ncbi:hypothetical protein CRE_10264 [Caenorhabditis remanei]|uniref:Sdz-33 F-box domain-containing protein n=1 Tax=Caenorhabditis remanei TaxID=31234 RepID=E3M672_CAERE|nr:hypothetical protein CRE_10264 [Caenorhabditis remanei]
MWLNRQVCGAYALRVCYERENQLDQQSVRGGIFVLVLETTAKESSDSVQLCLILAVSAKIVPYYKNFQENRGKWSQLSNDENEMRFKYVTVWADYVCDLFRRDITFLYLNSNESLQEISAITEWMNTRQTCLEYCEFSGDDTNCDTFDLFFEKMKFSIQNLCYAMRHTHEIRQFNCGILDLNGLIASSSTVNYPVNWITEEDIITSNCVTIVIGVCYFNENNLNRVLKGWIDGNNPRMTILTLAVKRLDFELLLDGIEFEEKDESLKRTLKSEYMAGKLMYEFEGGFDIRQKNGKLATIQQKKPYKNGEEQIFWFVMAVWPNNA